MLENMHSGMRWERALHGALGSDYEFEPPGLSIDFVRSDQRRAIELKHGLVSMRDLHAAVMQLAVAACGLPHAHLTLIAHMKRAGAPRIKEDWNQALAALQPTIASRLSLIAFARDGDLVLPTGDDDTTELARLARRTDVEAQHHGT